MEFLLSIFADHASYAHYVIFGLLILAGLNIPISEDLVIIGSGVLVATVIPENGWKIFLALYSGAFLSDLLVYFLGWHFGHRLWQMRWFSKMISHKRLDAVKKYYQKYGVLTLIIGRFIPFGVRNALFITAGMGRMRFFKFLLTDAVACLISNVTLFTLAYYFAKNDLDLKGYLTQYNLVAFALFCIALIAFFWYKGKKSPTTVEKK